MGIININIYLVLLEYFVSMCINECFGENVKFVLLLEVIDLLILIVLFFLIMNEKFDFG